MGGSHRLAGHLTPNGRLPWLSLRSHDRCHQLAPNRPAARHHQSQRLRRKSIAEGHTTAVTSLIRRSACVTCIRASARRVASYASTDRLTKLATVHPRPITNHEIPNRARSYIGRRVRPVSMADNFYRPPLENSPPRGNCPVGPIDGSSLGPAQR